MGAGLAAQRVQGEVAAGAAAAGGGATIVAAAASRQPRGSQVLQRYSSFIHMLAELKKWDSG